MDSVNLLSNEGNNDKRHQWTTLGLDHAGRIVAMN